MRKSLLTAFITLMTFSTAPAFLQKAEAQTAQWLPENQSLNILDYASQIVRMDYKQMDRNPSREACKTESQNQATSSGSNIRAIYYYHRDSNFVGAPSGPGHCYSWLYDTSASRSSLLTSVLLTSLTDSVSPELSGLLGAFSGSEDAKRKINGLHFRHFGFHAFESSDVCLKKVNKWRRSEGGNWAVWSHQANNCLGIMSKESFTDSDVSSSGSDSSTGSSSEPLISSSSSSNLKGWVWFDGSNTPNSYQYNSKGATNKVTRLGKGRYRVSLPKLGTASGTVHVTSYNSDRHCKVVNWNPSGSTQRVNVNCFQANGTIADSKFSMLFYKRSGKTSGTDAYLWYNGSTAPATYQWNSKGLKNTVSKLGTGRYQAKLPGINKLGGTVLVTAYGSDSTKCKVVNWGTSSNTSVNVNCFQGNKPVNSKFTLSYINGKNGVGNGFRHKGGYVWANNPNAKGTYTPSTTYQWNSATSSNNSIKVTNLPATGSYRVNLPKLIPANKTNTQVTAYGKNSDYCNISSWVSDGSGGTNANVKCFNSAGKAVDTRFTLTYLTNR